MGKITLLDTTTKNPITLIGERAGICWNADITDADKNYKRGLDCLESEHGRVFEFVTVDIVIEGYSARVIREYMRHVGGGLTVLQESTRYINYGDFEYIIPDSVKKNDVAMQTYTECMKHIGYCVMMLEKEYNVPREDAALLLPFGMQTKLVDHKNLRTLIDMSRTRECMRAYWEFRDMFRDIKLALASYSEEWARITNKYMHAKCVEYGYCTEKNSCGRYPKRGDCIE